MEPAYKLSKNIKIAMLYLEVSNAACMLQEVLDLPHIAPRCPSSSVLLTIPNAFNHRSNSCLQPTGH